MITQSRGHRPARPTKLLRYQRRSDDQRSPHRPRRGGGTDDPEQPGPGRRTGRGLQRLWLAASCPVRLAALPAQQILSKADAAARAAGSLHFSSTTRQGPTSIDFSDDSEQGGGRQDITMSDGGQMTVLLIAGIGYVNGNAAALNGFLGMTDAMSAQLAGQWISFRAGSPGYQQVVDGVTTSSVLREIIPAGPLTKTARQTIDGQSVIGVSGPAPASAQLPKGSKITLYVAAKGGPLPVSCLERTRSGLTNMILSHWGEQVSVAPPRNAVPVPVQSTPPAVPGVA